MDYLMFIALWCGQPSYSRLETKHVNSCREEFLKCLENIKFVSESDVKKCAKKIKLGDIHEQKRD
jgi:hypothetical protein